MKRTSIVLGRPQRRRLLRTARRTRNAALRTRYMIVLHTAAGKTQKQIAAALGTAATSPTQAIKTLAQFAADLTDTFNHRVTTVYSGMSGRVVGPMLLVESSRALGSPGAKPAAMLAVYTLDPGHTFSLGTFIDGAMPPESQVALSQTLVSLT